MAKRKLLSKRNVSLISALIVLLLTFAQSQGWLGIEADQTADKITQSQPGLYTIDHFIDGDTIAVKMSGKTETVRMIGVDTPETHKPNTPVQCYGPAAAAFTKNLIGENKIRLESDSQNQDRDRYGRLLRYVYLADGRLVEKELILGGYGFAYTSFPFTKKDEFVAYEKQAQAANKGLWRNCTVTGDARKQTNAE
jgi:micrococcal nuclease